MIAASISQQVKRGLDILGVSYRVDPFLVRGLDYYTKTVFEITHSGLGAQDAVGAGGRYDNLVKELGGPDRRRCWVFLWALSACSWPRALIQRPFWLTPIDCYLIAFGRGRFG